MFVYESDVCYCGCMPPKITPEVFVERVAAKHGDKVKVDPDQYRTKDEKITAECYKHGDFETTPARLWKGHGCPVCGRPMNGMTTDIWIKKARDVHGEKYDYSKVKYTKANKKVVIVCPEHGEFTQEANSHLQGHGCKLCGTEQATGTADYAARAEKRKQTVLDKYGVDNVMKVDAIREIARLALSEKYGEGVTNMAHIPGVTERRQQTLVERYGATSYIGSVEGKKRVKQTNMEKYGYENPMQNPNVIKKYVGTRISNGTWNTSSSEEELYSILVNAFGEDDVVRQYTCGRYPWLCDFYIKSRDLFIEANYHFTHCWGWFDLSKQWCLDRTLHFANKLKDSDAYGHTCEVWMKRDVDKRNQAEKENLNYVVFWDDNLIDVQVWVALGCPDGQDWREEYSWLPDRPMLQRYSRPAWTKSAQSMSQMAKWYHFDEFFKRELRMWEENGMVRRMNLRMFLYANRLKYEELNPYNVTDRVLINAMRISGLLRGYSSFDTTLMTRVLKKYDIKSVYDPCAGWGERMLACHVNNVSYAGVDINEGLRSGYEQMIEDLSIQNVDMCWADSSDVNVSDVDVDAVITCPPYGNTEIYTDKGAENLNPTKFIEWWGKVVDIAVTTNAQYFCIQISQKWKKPMVEAIERHGFSVVEELCNNKGKVSHFNRVPGQEKKEFESFVVLQRD